MAQRQGPISQMRAITISREYGSGGGEIAYRLAQRLGWQLIDHEVVVRVARELGVSIAEAEEHDEHEETLVERILESLQMLPSPVAASQQLITPVHNEQLPYNEACQRVIAGAVATGQSVIVGRGSQVVLAERRDVFHVRIVAPLELRIRYVMNREGLDRAAAQERIRLKDQDRRRYLQAQFHCHPADPLLYDIVANTAVLDLDSVADLIILALECKGRRLTTPPEQLGPGAGLPRYPERPGDFRPPLITGDTREG